MAGTLVRNERSSKWDILKFAMIFLVVLGHAAEYNLRSSESMRSLFFFIYTFHMPVFIFVSGLFAKRTVNERKKDKIASYLVLYLLFKLFVFGYKSLLTGMPKFTILTEGAAPWFMLALFEFTIITTALKNVSPKIVLPVSILLACAAGYIPAIGDFLVLSRVIVYFPFYYAGYILDIKKLSDFCKSKLLKISSAVLLIAYAWIVSAFSNEIFWLRPLLTGRNPFSTLGEFSGFGFLLRLAYYIVVAIISLAVITIIPEKTLLGIIPKLGQRTLSVYFFHSFALYSIFIYPEGKAFFSGIFPIEKEWFIVLISIAITLVFSLRPFNDLLSFLSALPFKKPKVRK